MVDSTDNEIKEIQDTSQQKKMSKKEIGQSKSILQAPSANTNQQRMSSISLTDQSDQFISHDDLFKS